MKNTLRSKHPTRWVIGLLLAAFNLAAAVAATPAPPTGAKVYPVISNAQTLKLLGGSALTASWPVPTAGSYKLWVQIPGTSSASNATYFVYPQGNAVGNSSCSRSDKIYPCFEVVVNQADARAGWAQLMVNNLAATSWKFGKGGFVRLSADSHIGRTEQLGVGEVSFQNAATPPPVFKIGQSYQGGRIAYIDSSKQHGMIAAPFDQAGAYPNGIQWDNGTFPNDPVTGATGTAIGTGQANTTAIVKAQGPGSYAAKLCDDLVLGGYSDWYLPSKDELNQLYLNQAVVGGFANYDYWSSSENDTYDAWYQYFGYGYQYNNSKYSTLSVRAVRAF